MINRRMVSKLEPIAVMFVLAGLVAALSAMGRTATAAESKRSAPIVTIVRHGGLCMAGAECRSVLRITDTSVAAAGYVTRRLSRRERAALLGAIDRLDLAALRKHPFKGTCPTAYDGT